MHWEQQIQYATRSDIGFRRRNNQDSCCVQICADAESWKKRGHLLMVADGMGGHAVGELASKIATDTLPHTFFKIKDLETPAALKVAIESANAAIYERGVQNLDFQRMGTTCSTLILSPQGAIIGHVGDSRVYRIRQERIDQLSFDHSLQWELLRQGKLKPEDIFLHEPRHVITRSLGPEADVKVDIEGPYAILPGDTYLLCSDGLTGHLTDTEIGTIARELPAGDACRLLVNLANLRGGSDNITVVIARIGELPDGATVEEDPEPHDPDTGLSWWWLFGFWGIAATFVTGVILAIMGWHIVGAITAAVAVVVFSDLVFRWWAQRSRPAARDARTSETVLWKSYRSATAKISDEFLNHLLSIELELQRAAMEEGWSINWSAHDDAYTKVKDRLNMRQPAKALHALAKAIDALMAGVHLHRKQMDRKAKWGRGVQPGS